MRRGGFHADLGLLYSIVVVLVYVPLSISRHLCFPTRKHTDTHTLYHQSSSAYHTEHSWIFNLSLTRLSVFVFSFFLSHLYESIIYYATILLSLVLFFLLTISRSFVNDNSRPLQYSLSPWPLPYNCNNPHAVELDDGLARSLSQLIFMQYTPLLSLSSSFLYPFARMGLLQHRRGRC